jgi:hypothetical protein
MKNKCFMTLLVFSVFCFVSIGLYAQSSSVDQKIVGRWVDGDGKTWVFSPDGTGTYDSDGFKYAAFGGRIIITSTRNDFAYEYFFSSDNNTVILFPSGSTAGRFLTKQR